MPAQFTVIAKANPQNREAAPKYYPSIKNTGRINRRRLAVEAADRSTLSDADMDAALANLLTLIPKHLAEGHIVDLGDFGTFRLTITSEGSDSPDLVTGRNIKRVNVRFTPGQAFKESLGVVRFEKVNNSK